MDTKVKLQRVNGEIIEADIISYFELQNTGKRYVFYTLNEIVENDLVKMYVSEVGNANMLAQTMADEDWTTLKSIMKSILTGHENPNVKYLKWEAKK